MTKKPARPARTAAPSQARAPAATDLRGICRQAALAWPDQQHGQAIRQIRARLAGTAGTARLANIALRIALIRQWQPARPVQSLDGPPPAPPAPKGRVNLVALQDVARMLATDESEPAPPSEGA